MPTIIFDFNRTLFSPETDMLYPDAISTCAELRRRGYELLLLSQEHPERHGLIVELGLDRLFERVLLTPSKDVAAFRRLLEGREDRDVTVVGDGAEREIRIGNALGYRTIWIDRSSGAFGYPFSVTAPWRTASELHYLLELLP